MPVNTAHPQYEKVYPYWERIRDAVEGEDAIKAKTTRYLPIPSGIAEKGERSSEYKNYLARAKYPESVGPAVEAMTGLMSRKEMKVSMPESLAYLEKEATSDGLPLDSLINRLKHEVITTGRYVLFVDVPENEGNPYIAAYPAESLINWRGDAERLTRVVFKEMVTEPDPDDRFEDLEIEQYRVAEIEDGTYVVRVYRNTEKGKEGEDEFKLHEEYYPQRHGENLDFIPVVIIGSRDLLPEPDAIPLLSVANKSLHYYRQYADYALQLFMCANGTTPYCAGDIEEGDIPTVVGSGVIWGFTSHNVKCGYIEVSGNGLDSQKSELDNISMEIAQATIRALGDKKTAEAAETMRLRFQSQTATLASIAKSCASGLEKALRFVAEWTGANPALVEVVPNLEFIREMPEPNIVNALMNGIEKGLVPHDILAEYLRRTDMHEMDIEEYMSLSPAAVALEPGDDA